MKVETEINTIVVSTVCRVSALIDAFSYWQNTRVVTQWIVFRMEGAERLTDEIVRPHNTCVRT